MESIFHYAGKLPSPILGHEEHVKDAFHADITRRLQVLQATIYCGTSTFLDAHTIQVNLGSEDGKKDSSALGEEIQLRGEKILIATGSSPVHPDVFPFGHSEIYDSDTILKLDRIPNTLAVVGAGVIGAEYGCTFNALGAEVHILDGRDVLLPFWMRRFPRRCWGRFNAAESFFTGKKMCRNAFRWNPVAFGSNSPPVRH